ncbi:MAG: SIS domain-containing protein [Armatimonadetes bacterium]|nr:SIS domain-containing protein [Armatimonadota bacterium]
MTHMLDEIREQPQVVRRIVDEEFHRAEALAAEIKRRQIAYAYVAARGTSDNAAIYGKYLLEIQQGLPVALAAPSVFTLYDAVPHFGPNALVLGISQSGAAPDVIAVVRRAREAGALTACITNEPDSELARAAEYPLFIGAGEEVGVAATKTYTGSLALLALLSTALDESHPERLEHLRWAADAMERTLSLDDALHHLVEKYRGMRDCIVLGRGYNHATAAEVGLKVTETCYVSAQAFSAADFQHGPIAQVASGFPCLLFAPDGKAFAPMAQLAERLRAQHPALICFAHDPAFLARSETAVRIPAPVAEWVSPLVYVVAGQLFAYWLSVARGNDPDAPRGLAKVTQTV